MSHVLTAVVSTLRSMVLIGMTVLLLVAVGYVRNLAEPATVNSDVHVSTAGSIWDNPPVPVSGAAALASEPPVPAQFAETLVGCEGLTINFEGERNTTLDLDHELLMMYPGDDASPVTVRYTDPACIDHPVVGPLITDVVDEAYADLEQECQTLMDALAAGELPTRASFVPSVEKAEAHIARWC